MNKSWLCFLSPLHKIFSVKIVYDRFMIYFYTLKKVNKNITR